MKVKLVDSENECAKMSVRQYIGMMVAHISLSGNVLNLEVHLLIS